MSFPWAASGRATTIGRNDGLTKLVIEPGTQRVLGVGIVGPNAGELIAEGTLAVEMGARADDLRFTIHAHPTLSETLMETAEVLVEVYTPGMMSAGLLSPIFWGGMLLALSAGFVAAWPINYWLVGKGIRHVH